MLKNLVTRLLFRPEKVAKEIRDVVRHIDFVPRVRISNADSKTKYVCIDSQHITMPRETWESIKGSVLKLNYEYKGGRLWFIEKEQSISTTAFTEEELTALRVAYRMEHGHVKPNE